MESHATNPSVGTADRIRDTAEALFARHGYAAVSMRDIGAAVGIQAGAIYGHFKGKEALLRELLERHLDARFKAWKALPAKAEAGDQLRAFTRFHVDYRLDHPDASAIEALDLRNLPPEARAGIEARRAAYVAELHAILDHGQETAEFNLSDTGITADAMIALLDGVADGFASGRSGLRRGQVGRICWRLLRRMAGPDLRQGKQD